MSMAPWRRPCVAHGGKRLEEAVLAGEIDVASSLLPISNAFAYQHVRREPIMALLPFNHELAGRERVEPASLAGSPLVLFGAEFLTTDLTLGACRRIGITPWIAAQSGQIDFEIELVATGLGVGFLPRMIAE